MSKAIDLIDMDRLPIYVELVRAKKKDTAQSRMDLAISLLRADKMILLGRQQHAYIVAQRWSVAWILHHCGWSYPQIGKALNRDHTSMINGVSKIRQAFAARQVGEAA